MSILKAALCFIILYVGITIAISFINALLLGLEFSGYNRMDSLFKENRLVALRGYFLLFSAASSRILELMSGFFVIFLIWIYTRRVTAGFLFLQCTYILCLMQGIFTVYLPFGMSSLSRMSQFAGMGGISYLSIMTVLLITNVVLYFIAARAVKNKIIF